MRPLTATLLFALLSGSAFSQPADAPPTFQIADIHTSPHSMNPFMQGGIQVGDRYQMRQATMVDLIRTAYGVEADSVVGGPSRLELDRFDVIAKTPRGTPPETVQLMLQALLADRFKLVTHKGTKPLDAFVLSLGKGQPKLKEAEGTGLPGCQPQISPSKPGATPRVTASCHNVTMDALAIQLHQMAGGYLTSPVVNTTALKGAWDVDIAWTPRGALGQPDGISIFDAVDKQLGLKLEFQKFPTPVVAVDSVNRQPTPNPPGIKETLPPPPPTEFEVAALKPSLPDTKPGGRGFQPGGRIDFQAVPLAAIIQAAWDLHMNPGDDIPGAPKWVSTAKYDLVAKTYNATGAGVNAPPIDLDDLRGMLRALLIDKLKMVIHYEDRPQPAYTLVASKPKMKKADPSGRTGCKLGQPPPGKNVGVGMPTTQATCQNMTMAQFAEQLPTIAQFYIHSPVLDASGIEGAWDFTLVFSPIPPEMMNNLAAAGGRGGAPPPPPPPPGAAGGGVSEASEPNGAVSIFEAVERELGIKLEMHKRNLPLLVIDHIEEKPDN